MKPFDKSILEAKANEIAPVEGFEASFLKAVRGFPFLLGEELYLLLPSADNIFLADLLERQYGRPPNIFLAEEDYIFELIQKFYEIPPELEKETQEEEPEDLELLKDLASEAPVVRLVNRVIREAVEMRATDIHFESERQGLRIRYRIDGLLHEIATHPRKIAAPVISRLKLMAGLNIAEHRLPQDGRIRFRVGGEDLDIRVSTMPAVTGESVVLRLLARRKGFLTLEKLGLEPEHYQIFLDLISQPNGIILVTGPTGSGKTTTLYAALSVLNKPDRKIITIEDPVEYQLQGITQIQIKPQIGLTFAQALRSILRHDPDVILVGEIRDLETAEIAIQAALTGHLVFSTLHTRDALGAAVRLADMGVEPYLIAASTVGLVAQRLVRVLCDKCAEEVAPPEEFLAWLERLPSLPEKVLYRRPVGCPHCAGTGFYGRIAIYEIYPVDGKLRRLILRQATEEELKDWARERGYLSLFQDGLRKVAKGITSLEEVLRVSGGN
ncbi:GspE/PulE family protein [Thermodesulfatator autotrophicus]|uniref:Type II secretion system protein GspE n=1 Tax=Thermodesulfatator autotrophicus TaxID=1795632 RepID=A0A177E8T8_9BACT|nr:GspE/PulE family protein [Thermodesulfatator autotrophicus]OAG28208.1 type II secretion system protein GspE [Thermodesulfatator autotrophicus]